MQILAHKDQLSVVPAAQLQGKQDTRPTAQITDRRPESAYGLQVQNLARTALEQSPTAQFRKMATAATDVVTQRAKNKTGLPDQLKGGLESMSGLSMDGVKVHYNSSAPAQLNAHAYAQGTDIHLASGQEQHLPHEAWHVVQQMQGRVRPTTEVNGQQVNDSAGLEGEADRMGSKAAQLMAKSSGNALRTVSMSSIAIQRKINSILPGLPVANPFEDGNIWTPYRTEVITYNNISVANKVYASHAERLKEITTRGTIAYANAKQQKALNRQELLIQLSQLEEDISIKSGMKEEGLTNTRRKLQAELADLSQQESQQQLGLDTMPAIKDRLELKMGEIRTAISDKTRETVANQTEIDETRRQSTELPDLEDLIRIREERERAAEALKVEIEALNSFKANVLDGTIHQEVLGVKNQLKQPDAEFEAVPESRKIGASFRKPARINKLAQKITAEAEDIKKIKLIDELQDLISNWRAENTISGTNTIKPEITGSDAVAAQATIKSIVLIEQQMLFTRNTVFQNIFAGPVAAPAAPAASTNRSIGFAITDSLLTGVGGEATAIKTGMKLDGPPTVFGVKETSGSILGSSLLPKSEAGVDATAITSSATDMIARLIKFKDIQSDWQKAKGKMESANVLVNQVDAVTNVVNDGTTIAENIVNATQKGRSSISKFAGKDKFGQASEIIADITSGIMALKNGFLTVKYFWEASRRKGTDKQQGFTFGAKGAITFAKSAEGFMKLAAGVLKSFFAIAPEPLLRTIPILGIAIDLANGALSIYTGWKANQAKKEVASNLEPYKAPGAQDVEAAGLAAKLTISTPEVVSITSKEQRGVLGGKEKYLRLNAYVMAKIDEHIQGANKDDNLVIDLDGATTVTLTKEDVAIIREYEYVSKMTEINQKRKTFSVQSAIKTGVGLVGKITTAAGVTAMVGVGINAAVTAGNLTQALAKGGQKIKRNNRRKELDALLPANATGIEGFSSQKAYLDARGAKSDRSVQQKEAEYNRHAFYIMDRIATLPDPPTITAPAPELEAAQKRGERMTGLLTSTGVDMFLFLNAAGAVERIKLLIAAQKAGR